MGKFKIVITATGVEVPKLLEIGELVYPSKNGFMSTDEFLSLVKDADAAYIYPHIKINDEVLDQAPKLKIISTHSTGYNHIDLDACKKRNIKVGYAADSTTEVCGELGMALLLATARRFPEMIEAVRDPSIDVKDADFHLRKMLGRGVEGSVVGIYGLGNIGEALLRRVLPFKPAKVLYHNRSPRECAAEYVSFDDLLKLSDFLIITVAENPDSIEKFNRENLEKMKKGAILINISRGSIVKTMDLYEALKSGHLQAAGLDVTDPEPLPYDHPLMGLKNCLILPHVGSATIYARAKMNQLMEENIYNGLLGKEMTASLID